MCIQLHAVKLIVVTRQPIIVHHNGARQPHYDCPVGTVLAYDADDNLYVLRNAVDNTRSSHWPTVKNGYISLYRDHWKHIASGVGTPYGDAFRGAKHRVLREVK